MSLSSSPKYEYQAAGSRSRRSSSCRYTSRSRRITRSRSISWSRNSSRSRSISRRRYTSRSRSISRSRNSSVSGSISRCRNISRNRSISRSFSRDRSITMSRSSSRSKSRSISGDSENGHSERSDYLKEDDIDFTKKSLWADLQLEVEGRKLYVPKSHLALMSPVFRRMFDSSFRERDASVIPLPGKNYNDVLIFLQCTLPGTPRKITDENVFQVLPLAHEYQVKGLLDECQDCLLRKLDYMPTTNVVGLLRTEATISKYCKICVLAEKYSMRNVVEKFVEKASVLKYYQLRDVNKFNEISIEIRYRILHNRLVQLERAW